MAYKETCIRMLARAIHLSKAKIYTVYIQGIVDNFADFLCNLVNIK